jgi:hypothetical protein
MNAASFSAIEFSLPPELEASAPPEARGLRRDEVRLMISNYSTDQVKHTRFHHLDKYLNEGDVSSSQHQPHEELCTAGTRADGSALWNCIYPHFDDDLGRWNSAISMSMANQTSRGCA